MYTWSKVFVTETKNDEAYIAHFKRLVERFDHIITLYFSLPKRDKETLEKFSIPSYEPVPQPTTPTKVKSSGVDEVDARMLAKPIKNNNNSHGDEIRGSLISTNENDCNSEDSSLSDSDRTLVESYSPYSAMCADQFMQIPTDGSDIANTSETSKRSANLYFKCEEYTEPALTPESEPTQALKVMVDNSMIIGKLKERLEPIVKVPQAYFKIFRHTTSSYERECSKMTEQLTTFK